jgi:2-hydroxychromene-2-carboxylate isomerase
MSRIQVTHFTDPGCPWAWSASPALAVLRWRFGDQLQWRHVMIGLAERREQYADRGYTPLMMAQGHRRFRRYGMPFGAPPKAGVAATALACRAIVAVRTLAPELEWAALRALQFQQFCTPGLLDDPGALERSLDGVPGLDGAAVLAAADTYEVVAAYDADRAESRTAEGSPTEAQGKAAATDGPVRYTAPSLIFANGARTLEAGGFQPVEAYDVLLANLDPRLERREPAGSARMAIGAFAEGLVTAEAAAVMGVSAEEAELDLLEALDAGQVRRTQVGDGVLWTSPVAPALRLAA